MKTNEIVYPYWENLARYEETKQRNSLTWILVLLIIPLLSLIFLICFLYSNRAVALIPFKAIKRKIDEKSEAKKYKLMEKKQQERLEEEQREHEARMQLEAERAAAAGQPAQQVEQPQMDEQQMNEQQVNDTTGEG